MEKQAKKILILAYYYPPLKSMGVMRSYFFSHTLLQYFKKVTVLSTQNAYRLQQDPLAISPEIALTYLPTLDYRTITSFGSEKSHYSETTKDNALGRFVVKFLNSFPFNLLIGEGGIIYSLACYFKAKKMIQEENITHVFSSFRPFSDHFTAYLLKRKFPNLFWIADYRDIHVDVLKDNVFGYNFQYWCNRKIAEKANIITSISKGCLDHFKDYNPNRYLMYNGVYKAFHNAEEVDLAEKFTIGYTGSLYDSKRDPSVLFQAIRNLLDEKVIDAEKINIIYAGKDGQGWNQWVKKYQLETVSTVHGLLPIKASLSIQKSSHINLLLTFSHPEVQGAITGKMFEYLSSKRLLLCLINGVKDEEIESFVNSFSSGDVFYNKKEELARMTQYVQSAYVAYQKNDVAFFHHEKVLDQVSWENMTKKLIQHIDHV